jgi:hypothetical protein
MAFLLAHKQLVLGRDYPYQIINNSNIRNHMSLGHGSALDNKQGMQKNAPLRFFSPLMLLVPTLNAPANQISPAK